MDEKNPSSECTAGGVSAGDMACALVSIWAWGEMAALGGAYSWVSGLYW